MHRQTVFASLSVILLSGLASWTFNFQQMPNFDSYFIREAQGATEAVGPGTPGGGPNQKPNQITGGSGTQAPPTGSNQVPNQITGGGIGQPNREPNQQVEDQLRELNKRVDVLEAVKASLQAWITILIFTITILASANIGLSVWQVSSITIREAENSLKDYDVRFQEIIQRTRDDIENRSKLYGKEIQKIAELAKIVEDEIGKDKHTLESTIREIQNEGNGLLEKMKVEGTILKKNLMNELADYHRFIVQK